MKVKTQEIYSELYQILNFLGSEYTNKLPKSLFNMLEEKRDIEYNPTYTEDIPLLEQNIRKETVAILALLHLNYWCENEDEKIELKQILQNNEDRYQEKLREAYNPDNIFKKHNQKNYEEENSIKSEIALTEYKESFFRRIINKIKNILHKTNK